MEILITLIVWHQDHLKIEEIVFCNLLYFGKRNLLPYLIKVHRTKILHLISLFILLGQGQILHQLHFRFPF